MSRFASLTLIAAAALALADCGGDATPTEVPPLRLSSIIIDGGSRSLERGSVVTLTATVRDTGNKLVTVPLVWRSSVDSIVTMGRDGQLTAGDTGVAVVVATALGVVSGGIGVHVVWQGPAKVATLQFTPPVAVSPDGDLADSIRVVVTALSGGPATGSRVAFSVKSGGGTISPASPTLVTVGSSGTAAAKWHLGSVAGVNTVTATVVGADSQPVKWVTDNPVTFSVRSYAALSIVQGDGQTGSILAPLSVTPSIRLVDSAGKPRAAVPINFSATGNGRVANSVASTAVDGTASPGVWTLGDATGDQQLIVTVEGAKIVLHATATGTSVRFAAVQAAAAQTASCARTSDQFVSCFGQAPQIGTGDPNKNQITPTLTAGGVHLTSVVGGGAHFCGTAVDLSIYCWGINAFMDTTGVVTTTAAPVRLQSNIAWLQVSPGGQHNCALANDHTAYCWGANDNGQLGDNGIIRRLVPQPVFGGFKFSAIAAGGAHSCGIAVDGTALCWGSNSSGQVGDGTSTTRLSATAVSGALHWKTLGAGANWSCGLALDGGAYCWGSGTGRATPGNYPSAPSFTSLSVGSAHACALTADGKAYCWGDNSSGQLGDSTTVSRNSPTEVVTLFRFASISAGLQQTCGVTTDGFLACWGRNTVGELGFSAPLVQVTPRYVVVGVQP